MIVTATPEWHQSSAAAGLATSDMTSGGRRSCDACLRHRTRRVEGVAPAMPAGYRQAIRENPSGFHQQREIRAAPQKKPERPRRSAALRPMRPPDSQQSSSVAGPSTSAAANGGRRSCDACLRHRTRRMEGVAPAMPAGYRQAIRENPSGFHQQREIRAAPQKKPERPRRSAALRPMHPPDSQQSSSVAGPSTSAAANGGRRDCDACGLPTGHPREPMERGTPCVSNSTTRALAQTGREPRRDEDCNESGRR